MHRYIAGFLLILITPCVFSQNDTSKGFPIAVFTVHNLTNVNSGGLDFCPAVYEGKLVFVSEREIDYVNLGENRFEKTSYLSIYFRPEVHRFTPSVSFSPAYIDIFTSISRIHIRRKIQVFHPSIRGR